MSTVTRWLAAPDRRRPAPFPGSLPLVLVRGLRLRIGLAVLVFGASPVLAGWFLWKAGQEKPVYTASVPVEVLDYRSGGGPPAAAILEQAFAETAREFLADSSAFLRRHHWEGRGGANRGVRYRYVSMMESTDRGLATETHRALVERCAERLGDAYPGFKVVAGAELDVANQIRIDDTGRRLNARLSLICGGGAYALGLTLLGLAAAWTLWGHLPSHPRRSHGVA